MDEETAYQTVSLPAQNHTGYGSELAFISESTRSSLCRTQIAKLLRVNLSCPNRPETSQLYADDDWVTAFNKVDWVHAFTEDGHLQLERLMSLLPPLETDKHQDLLYSYRNITCAMKGLAHFNMRSKGSEYELVEARHSCLVPHESSHLIHANFIAKRKSPTGFPPELFFTEMWACGDERGKVRCCIPISNTMPQFPDFGRSPWDIHHPAGRVCHSCSMDDFANIRFNLCNNIVADDVVYCRCKELHQQRNVRHISTKDVESESETNASSTDEEAGLFSMCWGANPEDFEQISNKRTEAVRERDGAAARIASLLYVKVDDTNGLMSDDGSSLRVHKRWLTEFLAKDWRACFDEYSNLLLDQVIDNLPKLRRNSDLKLGYGYQCLKAALKGLSHFNKTTKGLKYELVRAMDNNPIIYLNVTHANFVAEPRDGSCKPKLFFTEVSREGDWEKCDIVDPNPILSSGFTAKLGQIFHYKDAPCLSCDADSDPECDYLTVYLIAH